jgi:nitroimidazol reductase NimA-like FMN-containing flavoprotein (pyridoxamine 5'-phosphate oxidase superfamily)
MPVGRFAVTTKDGPYIVAVNYLYHKGSIYFHGGLSGRKMEALQADSRVCFLVDEVGPQVLWDQGCGISQVYKSVVCFGNAEFVEDPSEKRKVLDGIGLNAYWLSDISRESFINATRGVLMDWP